jgi:tetratricopeptide (TPR) repeat protein
MTNYNHSWSVGKIAKIILLLVFINGQWSMVNGQPATELYKQATNQYKAGNFEQAASSYEKILSQGYRTAEVYYNLGNCYYKLNNMGRAILNFERAHKLAPEDEDIIHNLKIAQLRTVDKVQPVPQLAITTAWNNFTTSQSSRGWGYLAVGLMWLSLVAFAIYLLVSRKGVVMFLGSLFLILSLSSFGLGHLRCNAEENSDQAILLVENVNVKSAPDTNGTDLFTIHEGIKFELCDRVGDWNKIRLADGKVGWIEKGLFEKI